MVTNVGASLLIDQVDNGLSLFDQLSPGKTWKAPVVVYISEGFIVWNSGLHFRNELLEVIFDCS